MDTAERFVRLILERGALRFGSFTLKSGRQSPYFFNLATLDRGEDLATLGELYAETILGTGLEFDLLFGAAYKGIPLVSATAVALARRHGRDVSWCFNRKEIKDHGEGGALVGADPRGRRVVVIDDVLTAGTAARHALSLLRDHGARPVGFVVALDREERATEGCPLSALRLLADGEGIATRAIARLGDVLRVLDRDPRRRDVKAALEAYRSRYGAESRDPS
jgi:orotate phosphoribosyltransferase